MMRRARARGASAMLLVGVVAELGACGSGTYIPSESIGDTGIGWDGGTEPTPPPGERDCDPSKAPEESPECLNEANALFVSPHGDDRNAGTRARPIRTFGAALGKATGKKRIYVCEGEYPENVKVTRSIGLAGGYDCAWAFTGVKPKIAPARGVALEVRDARAVVVDNFEVRGSSDGDVAGDSAIAAFVSNAEARFRTLVLSADVGREGLTPQPFTNWSGTAVVGKVAQGAEGVAAAACGVCFDGTFSVSGKGADVGGDAQSGGANPAVGGSNAGTSGAACTNGLPGAPGESVRGPNSQVPLGFVDAEGWHDPPAGDGVPGKPGQGGGGGGSRTTSELGGGSGSCGGCGGHWGAAGSNGGSSFVVLSFRSELDMESCTLTASAAGDGGRGVIGQAGQSGGSATTGVCHGGAGGAGGAGSGGGGGNGGHSAAIGYVGPEPKTRECALSASTFGRGMRGGSAATSELVGTPGIDGRSGMRLELREGTASMNGSEER